LPEAVVGGVHWKLQVKVAKFVASMSPFEATELLESVALKLPATVVMALALRAVRR